MKTEDEQLQENTESGKFQADSLDAKAYQYVFRAAAKEPAYRLDGNFADRVIQKVLAKKQQKESSRDFWWFGLGIFLLLIAFVVALGFIGFKINPGLLRSIADFKGLLITGAVLVWIFNILDKRLIKPQQEII
jgi:hypothetical protein